ncbi:MAG: hypothetical protein AAFV71_07160 [Cyanobacteria bacterium J06633_8]
MDKKALSLAIFMGLYVPLFTGISVTIHRLTQQTSQESKKIIIVHRQFKNQSFDDINKNLIFKQDESYTSSFAKNISEMKTLKFYKYLPPAYTEGNNLFQNIDFNKITIDESLF